MASLNTQPKQVKSARELALGMEDSLTKVIKELSKYESDLVEVQEVRWDRGDTKPEAKYIFFYGRE